MRCVRDACGFTIGDIFSVLTNRTVRILTETNRRTKSKGQSTKHETKKRRRDNEGEEMRKRRQKRKILRIFKNPYTLYLDNRKVNMLTKLNVIYHGLFLILRLLRLHDRFPNVHVMDEDIFISYTTGVDTRRTAVDA